MTDQHIVKQIYLLNKNDDPIFIIQEKSNWMGEFFQQEGMGICLSLCSNQFKESVPLKRCIPGQTWLRFPSL